MRNVGPAPPRSPGDTKILVIYLVFHASGFSRGKGIDTREPEAGVGTESPIQPKLDAQLPTTPRKDASEV